MITTIAIILLMLIISLVLNKYLKYRHRDNPKYIKYTFKYKYSNLPNSIPVKFLENWKISDMGKQWYIKEVFLEEDEDILDYLLDVWKGYKDKSSIYIECFKEVDGDLWVASYNVYNNTPNILINMRKGFRLMEV